MDLKFRCPKCNAKVSADGELAGQSLPCPHCRQTIAIPLAELTAGTVLAGYRIERKLGQGAMGEVYLADQVAMGRKAALKVLSRDLRQDREYVERFLKEVRNLGQLSHPHIVTAFEAGAEGGHYYLAMRFVDGEELESRVTRAGPLPEAAALRLMADMAAALGHAWNELRILHRDVKPANIMLDQAGEAWLMDLGVAKRVTDNQSLTMTGMAIGTPSYMSPEQAMGRREVDCRSDMYSLGATVYFALCGQVPFEGTNTVQVLTRVVNEPHRPVRQLNPKVSRDAEILLDRLLAKEPDSRYPTWEALLKDIKRLRAGQHLAPPAPAAGPATATAAPARSAGVALTLWILAAIVVVLLCALGVVLLHAVRG